MAVEADFGFGLEVLAEIANAGSDVLRQHVARRVRRVNAVCAVRLHQLGLFQQLFGGGHVRHHQKADGIHVQLTCHADMLFRHVGFGAMGGHTDGADPQLLRHFEVVNRADAG